MADDQKKPDLTPEEIKSLAPGQKAARAAYGALFDRILVLVSPKGIGPTAPIGSGMLLATTNGIPFILTARHILEEVESPSALALAGPSVGPTSLNRICERVFLGPLREGHHDEEHKYVDVAVAALNRRGREKLAVPAGFAVAESSGTKGNDILVISGFPRFLTRATLHEKQKVIDMDVASISYVTSIEGVDEFRRMKVEWHEARAIWDMPEMPHFKVEYGTTFELGAPLGISGGGVWRVRGPDHPVQGIWAPTTHCQLIGIASAKRDRVEFAEPVELWTDWLRSVEREIDSTGSSD